MAYYIYCVTNKLNNKSYVGQTSNIKERWANHKRDSIKKYKKRFYAFQNALNKYKIDNFIWNIIDVVDSIEEANEAEEFYIANLNTLAPNGYNLNTGGKNGTPSEETKKKISEKLKIVGSFVGKKGKDHPNFGTTLSQERKDALSKRFSGDNGSGKKITSIIAKDIYLDYLNNKMSVKELINKYPLKKVAIINILNKKSWKDILKDLPNIDLSQNSSKSHYKISNEQIIILKNKFKLHKGSIRSFCIKEMKNYNVTETCIYNILTDRRRLLNNK